MGDSYRPERGDRDRAPPLAERMTFTSGDNYRPGGRAPEFTFESSQPMPQLPSGGPANQGTRGAQRNRGGGRGRGGNTQRGGRGRGNANGPGRGNSNGAYRGGYRKAAPHERALLQQQHGGPEHTLGVAEGSNRFLNVDDMTDDEETDMVVENDASAGDGTSEGPAVREKVARLPSHNRADGDSVPRWSNPDPYTACPPPDETTGVKRDVVQLIRKAKNQDSEKAIGNNAVAANDDFISFGDNEDEDDDDLEEDDAGDQPAPKRTQPAKRMIVGSMNDIDYAVQHARNAPRNSYQPSASNKRRHGSEAQLTAEWMHDGRTNPTPWFHPKDYERLTRQPEKW
jgi:non-canonical poly(A) RNA polymerase PAPD5/7